MQNILITGATGFIGSFLTKRLLREGYSLIISSRGQNSSNDNVRYVNFTKLSPSEQDSLISECFAVINLAGESIAGKKWTPEQKAKLTNSRVDMTRSIANAISRCDNKPEVFVSASAVGFYGNRNDEILNEQSQKGSGFLSDVCNKWEEAAKTAEQHTRLVIPRIGVVLHPKAGALEKMILPFKLYAGGALGSGKQYLPWIHIDDLVEMFVYVVKNDNIKGVCNFSAPNPSTMNDFAKQLGTALNKPSFMRVPEFVLKAILGESSSMVLDSQRAVPETMLQSGFKFKFPELQEALFDLL